MEATGTPLVKSTPSLPLLVFDIFISPLRGASSLRLSRKDWQRQQYIRRDRASRTPSDSVPRRHQEDFDGGASQHSRPFHRRAATKHRNLLLRTTTIDRCRMAYHHDLRSGRGDAPLQSYVTVERSGRSRLTAHIPCLRDCCDSREVADTTGCLLPHR